MFIQKKRSKFLTVLATSAVIVFSGMANAADPLEESIKVEKSIITSAAASQKRITKLAETTLDLSQDYKLTMQRVDNLRSYNRQYQKSIESQLAEMASINDQMSHIDDTEKGVVPLMHDMIDSLEQFIALDIPFLMEEREKRVLKLRNNMIRADITNSEKYRQILEAYQIEILYGESISSYQGDAEGLKVNFLRFGRIALVWQSLDESRASYWNNTSRSWQQLDDEYRIPVRNGIQIALRRANDDLIILPIQAAGSAL